MMAPHTALLVASLVVVLSPARAVAQEALRSDRSWKASHIALASGFAVALWVDAAQTREAMDRGYREANPILGPHPTAGQINTYTAIACATVLGAAALMPSRWRPWLLGAALAVEVITVGATVHQGIAIQF